MLPRFFHTFISLWISWKDKEDTILYVQKVSMSNIVLIKRCFSSYHVEISEAWILGHILRAGLRTEHPILTLPYLLKLILISISLKKI